MTKKTLSVAEFLDSLPEERAKHMRKVRALIRKHLPTGYQECVSRGMISYQVPLKVLADTYNKEPLMYVALASQKNNFSLHLVGAYGSPTLRKKLEEGFRSSGKKLDMGKACLRFKSVDDLPLDTIGQIVAAIPMEKYVDFYKQSRMKTR